MTLIRNSVNNFTAVALLVLLWSLTLARSADRARVGKLGNQSVQSGPQTPNGRTPEQQIAEREKNRRGITVDRPKVYDDALLQQMLQAAESRLASIQLLDQTGIAARLGAITGATQQISSLGINAQGLPLPSVTTVSKGATGSTTQAPSGLTTINGLAAQDVTTTMPQVSPPAFTAPAPSTGLPTSFSVSASDVLNEQAQLTAEISALRLLIRGSLSDHFVKGDSETNDTKKKITLGFPITITPDRRYKDAIAVVEVEVSPARDDDDTIRKTIKADLESKYPDGDPQFIATELKRQFDDSVSRRVRNDPPAVTTLLPREKTYNVAAITDKSVSIGGGVATQLLGVSGSFLHGRKAYYVVQDQDTVALSYQPTNRQQVGFMWQFRPVLGQEYVKSGLKQPFVQLSFVALSDADIVGKVTVKTYWRKYDRRKGIVKEIIPDSYQEQYLDEQIRTYLLAKRPLSFNSFRNVEDLGSGQLLVRLEGRFLPGTYIRNGSTALTPGSLLTHEYEDIRFVASPADLVNKKTFLVATDGTETRLRFADDCKSKLFIDPKKLAVKSIDDTTTELTVELNEPNQQTTVTPRLIVIGSRVFGYSDAPVKREGYKLIAQVPNSLLKSKPDIRVQTLFPSDRCLSNTVPAPGPISQEKLAVLERGDQSTRFLLSGANLSTIQVLSPAGAMLSNVGSANPDKLRFLTLTSVHLKSNKQILVQRGSDMPFLISIPDLDVKKPDAPKTRERVTVDADEVVIEGDGLNDLVKVTYKKFEITSKEIAADGKSVRLTGLRAIGVTNTAASQPIVLEFKSGAKATVMVDVVNTKVETVAK